MSRYQSFQLERAVASVGHVEWESLAEVFVRLTPMRHRVSVRHGSETLLATHEARLRHGAPVKAGMRFRREGRVLLIHNVEPMGRREGWLSCLCEEQQNLAPEVS